MGFRVARKHAQKLARIAFAAGGVFPALIVVAAARAARRAGLAGGNRARARRARPSLGHDRRALAVLRRSAACRDELLRRLVAVGFATPVGARRAQLPALVEPHPLAGVLAHPALDHVVEQLRGGGHVDACPRRRAAASACPRSRGGSGCRAGGCNAPDRRRSRSAGPAWAAAGCSRTAGRRRSSRTPFENFWSTSTPILPPVSRMRGKRESRRRAATAASAPMVERRVERM